jgi:exosome complex component CSL4
MPTVSIRVENEGHVVPEKGSIVLCKVLKVTPRFAVVAIESVDGKTVSASFRGTIRVRDVMPGEVDKVQLYQCFRPGDLVRAEVISLGDARSYFLSTVDVHYGVILATSIAGGRLRPISHNEMICTTTNLIESRKVGKAL